MLKQKMKMIQNTKIFVIFNENISFLSILNKYIVFLKSLRNEQISETVSWKGSENIREFRNNSETNMLSKSSHRTDEYQ